MIARLSVAALLAAEAFAFYAIGELVAAGYGGAPAHAAAAWTFCLVAAAAFGLPRVLDAYGLSEAKSRVIIALLGALIIYAAVRLTVAGNLAIWDLSWAASFMQGTADSSPSGRAFVSAMLLLALWVRTSLRSREEVEVESIARSVAIPFAIVTLVVVVGAGTDRAAEVGRAGAAFYALIVVALAFAQLSLSGSTFGDIRAGGVTATLLAATLGAVVAGLVAVGFVLGIAGPVIGPPIGIALTKTLTIVLTPLAWALSHMFELLFSGSHGFPKLQPPTQGLPLKPAAPPGGESVFHRMLVGGFRGLALAIILGLAVGVAWFVVRLRGRAHNRRVEDHTDGSAGSFGEDLRNIFGSLFRRGHGGRYDGPSEVTRLYLDVLQRAEQTGQQRIPGETPAEFAPKLATAFQAAVTDDITQAFEQARYAGREPDPRIVLELQQRWKAVR